MKVVQIEMMLSRTSLAESSRAAFQFLINNAGQRAAAWLAVNSAVTPCASAALVAWTMAGLASCGSTDATGRLRHSGSDRSAACRKKSGM